MSYWAVVQTQSRREDAVVARLGRIGYETYLPKIKIRSQVGVLFPGYLFVRIFTQWYQVRWTEGVIGLLMTSDQSKLEKIMTGIHKSERNGFIPANPPSFKHGQKVRIINGSFAGQIATCAGMRGPERVCVLLNLLGQTVKVDLPDRDLEPLPVVAR
jgi:transcriptional antiterminator RfaH